MNALKAKDSNDSLKLPFGSFEVCFLAQLSFGRRQPPTAPEWPHLSPTAPASHPSLSAARWCEPAAPPRTPRLRLSAEGRTKGHHCQSFIFFLHEAFRPHTSSLIFLSRSRKKKKKSLKRKKLVMYQRAAAAGDGASMVYLALHCSKRRLQG